MGVCFPMIFIPRKIKEKPAQSEINIQREFIHLKINSSNIRIFRDLAYKSYQYLNQFRSNPNFYGEQIGLDLSEIKIAKTLIWDPTLIHLAELKAVDMAGRNYFNHIDPEGYGMNYRAEEAGFPLPENWIRKKNLNSIESIAANNKTPDRFIQQLIIDQGVDQKGHRRHLLATIPFYQKATHIGIGIAYNPQSEYGYYCCVLIAPKGK